MNIKNIITKLEENNLKGRGGANFPTGLKWKMVKEIKAEKKYIICNASEGEPDVFKDGFILENYPEEVISGIKIALETIDNSSAYLYISKDYYRKFKKDLEKLIGKHPITLLKKTGGYLAGEETSICEVIEGKRIEPRIRPPFPSQSGLWHCPTLINNVETFYCVAKIAKNEYNKTRFYSINGDAENEGVYELPEDYSISRILKETKNWPDFDFFVQSGGGIAGEILLPNELDQMIKGTGSIIVFNRKQTDLFSLMEKWINFLIEENCDKCIPCREGTYRIAEMIKKKKIDKKILDDLFFVLEESSFCALGKGVASPIRGVITKLLNE